MQSNGGDPLDWTVDEVVTFLCHNPQTPWSKSSSSAPRPDSASFEASLREHFITGEVLLQDVEKQTLRDDLGLKALGHRSSMMMAIRYLQQHSLKYQNSNPEQDSVTPIPLRRPPIPPSNHHTPQATGTHQTQSQFEEATPLPPISPRTPPSSRPFSRTVVSDTLNVGNEPDNQDVAALDGSSDLPGLAGGYPHNSPESMQLDRSNLSEQIVVDKHGKKRRRLNLESYVESPNNHTVAEESVDDALQNWYMGPKTLSAEQIFYFSDSEGSDQTFFLGSSKLPTAQREFVNSKLKYFFQQSPIELASNKDNIQQAVIPYRNSATKSSRDRFFTLYNAKQGKVSVSKEKIDEWPQLGRHMKVDEEPKSSDEPLQPSDPFSYLLDKYPVENGPEDAFPLYGDSGSEGGFDDETWQEMEDEQGDTAPSRQRKLGPVEVESVIKECIAEFEKNWHETRLPKEEPKARKLWISARRGNCTNQRMKALAREISLLTVRLGKFKDELCKNEYSTQAELRTICQCLEHTVFAIQKQKWHASVLEQKECPPKVSAPPKPQYAPKPRVVDEESLSSESDFSDGSLDDFVVVDTEPLKALQSEVPPASPSSSDGDDDIISVSGTRRRTRGQVPRVFASSSSSPSPPRPPPLLEKPDVIDLTMETPEPDDLMIETPPLNPVGASSNFADGTFSGMGTSVSPPPSLRSAENEVQVKAEPVSHSVLPRMDDMHGLLSVDWRLIEERRDRGILLAKLLATLSDEERNDMAEQIPNYQFTKLKIYVKRALAALSERSTSIAGLEASETHLIMRTAAFYSSWFHCVRLGGASYKRKRVDEALSALEDRKERMFDAYYDSLIPLLERSRSWQADLEASNESDSDSEPVRRPEPGDTPHKKRRKKVKESQSARANQETAQLRVREAERQKKKLEKRHARMGLGNDNPDHQAVSFKEPVICLNSRIGQRVKPHQLNGIRFMWRELIEDENQEGCLLAHTMGLGKTMQV